MSRSANNHCASRAGRNRGVPARFVVFVFVFVAPLVFRVPSDPAVGPCCLVRPWAAARPLAVRAASFARRVVSNPGQAPPPPMGDLSFVVHRVSSAHLAPSLVCLRSAMKPTAPLPALPCSGMKPPSPLRARKGLFRANSNLQRCWRFQWGAQRGVQRCWWFQWGAQRGVQRCWRFQWGAQRGVQRCWRFQSWSVIASCARKSSPRISRSCRGARKSSPCKPKTGEKRCLLVHWANFFAEEPLQALIVNVSMCVRSPCGGRSSAGEKSRMQFPSRYSKL